MTETKTNPETEPIKIKIGQVIDMAKEGRSEILPTLRALLDKHPELWQHYGDLGLQAQEHWLALISGKNLYLNECLNRKAAAMRESLADPDASPLEQLQAERIVALNLQLGYYEALLGKYEMSASNMVVDYLSERCRVMDHRLQQAIVNLARIRKLLPRVLKVDVVISGEIGATINTSGAEPEEPQTADSATRISVPENRIKDLLTAAHN